MAAALKSPSKAKNHSLSERTSKIAPRSEKQSTQSNNKKKKQDGWEMTASEALRINFVDCEL